MSTSQKAVILPQNEEERLLWWLEHQYNDLSTHRLIQARAIDLVKLFELSTPGKFGDIFTLAGGPKDKIFETSHMVKDDIPDSPLLNIQCATFFNDCTATCGKLVQITPTLSEHETSGSIILLARGGQWLHVEFEAVPELRGEHDVYWRCAKLWHVGSSDLLEGDPKWLDHKVDLKWLYAELRLSMESIRERIENRLRNVEKQIALAKIDDVAVGRVLFF